MEEVATNALSGSKVMPPGFLRSTSFFRSNEMKVKLGLPLCFEKEASECLGTCHPVQWDLQAPLWGSLLSYYPWKHGMSLIHPIFPPLTWSAFTNSYPPFNSNCSQSLIGTVLQILFSEPEFIGTNRNKLLRTFQTK